MAQKLTLNQRPAVRTAGKKAAKPNRLPAAVALCAGATVILAFSFTQVARVGPKRGNVNGIVQELRKEHPKGASSLPSRVDPTHGAKLWIKKGGA